MIISILLSVIYLTIFINKQKLTIMKEEKAGHKVLVIGNKCYRCGHSWIPRDENNKPPVCPKCKSPYWDKPKRFKNKK